MMGEIIHVPDQSWHPSVMDCFMERAVDVVNQAKTHSYVMLDAADWLSRLGLPQLLRHSGATRLVLGSSRSWMDLRKASWRQKFLTKAHLSWITHGTPTRRDLLVDSGRGGRDNYRRLSAICTYPIPSIN